MPIKSSSKLAPESGSLRRGFKTEAEKIAVEYRHILKLKDYDPLPALQLATHLNIEVLSPEKIIGLSPNCLNELLHGTGSNNWSAVTIGKEKPSLIIYNNSHSSVRTESDIMHEIAHIILDHTMGKLDTSFGILLRKYNINQENEAEWLGACLQLPKSALLKYYVFKSYSINQIAEMFNASQAMVNYRIGVSGVKAIKLRWKQKKR